jgi:hypothetical protein
MVGLGVIWGWDYLQGEQAVATTPLRQVTASSIAQRMREARGHVMILTLYRPDSEDPYVVADLRRWAVQTRDPKVELISVAVGSRRETQFLFRYGMEAGVQRLPPEWLPAAESETLDSALLALGVRRSNGHSSLPLTTVLDRNGAVAAQWRGSLDYVPVLSAAKAARQR